MPTGGFEQASRTHVGCRRKLNEDALLANADRGLWAVADGMGGHEAGDVASAMVVDALSRCGSEPEAIAALADVNARLIALGRSGPEARTIGSTVVGLILNGAGFTCFWAGDSRAYRLRDRKLVRLTHDHSLVQELVDAGMIGEDEAETHPNANVITRAVGVADRLEVDSVRGDVRSGDLFLLASDGLTRLVGDQELGDRLASAGLDEAADGLLELTLDREAPDNVSLILVRAAA